MYRQMRAKRLYDVNENMSSKRGEKKEHTDASKRFDQSFYQRRKGEEKI